MAFLNSLQAIPQTARLRGSEHGGRRMTDYVLNRLVEAVVYGTDAEEVGDWLRRLAVPVPVRRLDRYVGGDEGRIFRESP